MTWNFGKLQLTSAIVCTPLWVFSRFSRSKHNEFWSRHHCINSETVQLLWPVISLVYNLQGGKLSTAKKIRLLQAPVASFVCAELFSVFRQLRSEFWHYIKINGHSFKKNIKKQTNKNCRHRNRRPQFFCDVIMSASSAWSSQIALHVLRGHWRYPKSERNKTRLTLAPNRGSLGVLWTYSGSVVVLSWDSTHKNTQTSTQAHACRVTLTLARSTQTRGLPRPHTNIRLLHKDIIWQQHTCKSRQNCYCCLDILVLTSTFSV